MGRGVRLEDLYLGQSFHETITAIIKTFMILTEVAFIKGLLCSRAKSPKASGPLLRLLPDLISVRIQLSWPLPLALEIGEKNQWRHLAHDMRDLKLLCLRQGLDREPRLPRG